MIITNRNTEIKNMDPSQENFGSHKNKELILLVVYLNTGYFPQDRIMTMKDEICKSLDKLSEDVEEKTGKIIKYLVFLVPDQKTHIECIFPKLNEEDTLSLNDILNKIPL